MPLTDLEFSLWVKRLTVPRTTEVRIQQVRSSPPSRRGEGWGRSMTGFYPSRKMGVTITFDSHTVEYPGFLQTLEYDPTVLEYYNQPPPITLSYAKADTQKRVTFLHTPDVFVIRTQTAGWEEWKHAGKLDGLSRKDPARYHQDESGTWRCPPGEAYAHSLGLYYHLRSSAELSPTLHRNLLFLDDYHLSKHPLVVGEAAQQEILDQVRAKPGITLREMLTTLRTATADHVYTLIAQYTIYVDFFAAPFAEPDRVHLFRDQDTAAIYTHIPPSGFAPRACLDQSFSLVPGTRLSWDNRIWDIINVGETDVYLKGDGDRVITLSPARIEQLTQQGKLLGIPSPDHSPQSEAALKRLRHASPADLADARRKYDIIEPHITKTAPSLLLDSTPQRTIRDWIHKYYLGIEQFGMGILGLLSNLASSGNVTSRLSEPVRALIDLVIEEHHKRPQKPTAKYSHIVLQRLCRRQGQEAPSYETFCRYIRLKPTAALIRAREGARRAYKSEAPLILTLEWNTPRHGDRPFEIGHIDHTELPIELVDSLTGRVLGRPWATFLSDAFSRCVLAIYLSFAPPSYRSCMMILRICRIKHARWPQILVVDRGAEFQSTSFDFALASDNVTKKLRPSSAPRFGSTCERLFNTSQTGFLYNLMGNTQATRDPRTSTEEVDPRKLACWTLGRFYARLEEWATTIFAQQEHGGIHEPPRSAFLRGMASSGARAHRLAPYNEVLHILTMPVEHRRKAKVIPGRGVQHRNTFYWHPIFAEPTVPGTFVHFRPDIDDLGSLYVYVKQWVPAVSDHRALLAGRSYRELQIATEEYRRRVQVIRHESRISPANVLTWWDTVDQEQEALLALRRENEEKQLLRTLYGASPWQPSFFKTPWPTGPTPHTGTPSFVEPQQTPQKYHPQTLEVR